MSPGNWTRRGGRRSSCSRLPRRGVWNTSNGPQAVSYASPQEPLLSILAIIGGSPASPPSPHGHTKSPESRGPTELTATVGLVDPAYLIDPTTPARNCTATPAFAPDFCSYSTGEPGGGQLAALLECNAGCLSPPLCRCCLEETTFVVPFCRACLPGVPYHCTCRSSRRQLLQACLSI